MVLYNMASNFLTRLSRAIQKFEQTIDIIFGRRFPPDGLCVIGYNHTVNKSIFGNNAGQTLKDILNNGILWAVPKHRRTIEKRMKRKFGVPKYNWKPHVAKTNLIMCPRCGHDYEAGLLCGTCYERVKKETEEMQVAIQNHLGLSPVEKDVIVLYQGEKEVTSEDFMKKHTIVELKKERPEWFSKNLREPSTQEPSEDKDIKPTDFTQLS